MKRTVTTFACVLALGAAAFADDNKLKRASEPPVIEGAPSEVKRVRQIGADATPTKAGALEGGPHALAFSPDGRLLAVGNVDGGVGVTSVVESSDSATGWHRVSEHLGSVAGVAFVDAGSQMLVVSAGDDERLQVATLDRSLAVVSSASRALGLGPLTALAVLDARHVVVGSARGSLAVVKLGEPLTVERTFERHEGAIAALVALPKSRVASAGWDGIVKLSDASTGKELKAAKLSSVELTALAASPDGKTLAVGSWKTGVHLLDASTLRIHGEVLPHRGAASGLLLAGKSGASIGKCRLVSASVADECLAVSETLGSKLLLEGVKRTRLVAVPTGALALSPDGALVACAANDGTIGLYLLGGDR